MISDACDSNKQPTFSTREPSTSIKDNSLVTFSFAAWILLAASPQHRPCPRQQDPAPGFTHHDSAQHLQAVTVVVATACSYHRTVMVLCALACGLG